MDSKLKPCPLCGGEAGFYSTIQPLIQDGQKYIFYRVLCTHCGKTTLNYMTKQEAIDAWNTRANIQKA